MDIDKLYSIPSLVTALMAPRSRRRMRLYYQQMELDGGKKQHKVKKSTFNGKMALPLGANLRMPRIHIPFRPLNMLLKVESQNSQHLNGGFILFLRNVTESLQGQKQASGSPPTNME